MAIFKDYLRINLPSFFMGLWGRDGELGYDISGKLWSAKYLLDKPEVIQKIHGKPMWLLGLDLITTSSYQATLPGLIDAGLIEKEAEQIIALTVQLAKGCT